MRAVSLRRTSGVGASTSLVSSGMGCFGIVRIRFEWLGCRPLSTRLLLVSIIHVFVLLETCIAGERMAVFLDLVRRTPGPVPCLFGFRGSNRFATSLRLRNRSVRFPLTAGSGVGATAQRRLQKRLVLSPDGMAACRVLRRLASFSPTSVSFYLLGKSSASGLPRHGATWTQVHRPQGWEALLALLISLPQAPRKAVHWLTVALSAGGCLFHGLLCRVALSQSALVLSMRVQLLRAAPTVGVPMELGSWARHAFRSMASALILCRSVLGNSDLARTSSSSSRTSRCLGFESPRCLRRFVRNDLNCPLCTAFGSVELAVTCMNAGAADFITKPFKAGVLIHALERGANARWCARCGG